MEKEKNNKENVKGNTDENNNNLNKSKDNHITDFTSSKEMGEDATQYGEFISSFLENITKEK